MQHFESYSGISYVKQSGGLKYLFARKVIVTTHTLLELRILNLICSNILNVLIFFVKFFCKLNRYILRMIIGEPQKN